MFYTTYIIGTTYNITIYQVLNIKAYIKEHYILLLLYVKDVRKKAGKSYEKIGSGCSEDCMNCSEKGCTKRFYGEDGTRKAAEPDKEER